MNEVNVFNESSWHQSLINQDSINTSIKIDVANGDDGCVITSIRDNTCIVKDLSVENTHFKLEW